MNLVFDIFQGIGVAAAVGVRPFLPAVAVGALAAGDVQIDFAHSNFAFVQHAPFLAGMAAGVILLALAERMLGSERASKTPFTLFRAAFGLALGGLLFGAALCRGGYETWPGIVGGVVCAAVGVAASVPLLARVRSRLDDSAAGLLPLLAELAALLAAVLSVLAPPVGPILLALLLWLLLAGRGRDGQKYAGLRILR